MSATNPSIAGSGDVERRWTVQRRRDRSGFSQRPPYRSGTSVAASRTDPGRSPAGQRPIPRSSRRRWPQVLARTRQSPQGARRTHARASHTKRQVLSIETRSRGPLVAQTAIERFPQPCEVELRREKPLQTRPFRDVCREASLCLPRPVTPEVAGSSPVAPVLSPPVSSPGVSGALRRPASSGGTALAA